MSDVNDATQRVNLEELLTYLPDDWGRWSEGRQHQHAEQLYLCECVPDGRAGDCRTHDGEKVLFFADAFDHAFKTSADRRRRVYDKDIFDEERIERVRWIQPVIGGLVQKFECFLVVDHAKRPPFKQRLYAVRFEDYVYVVWLVPMRNGAWKFKTAFATTYTYFKNATARQRRLWPGSHVV